VKEPVQRDRITLRYAFKAEVPHNSEKKIGRLHLTFEPDRIPNEAFELHYRAYADGAPPVSGRLLVKWEPKN